MTTRTTWSGPREALQQAEQILTELIDPPVDAASLVRDDDGSSEPEHAPWLLHAYTEEPLVADVLSQLPDSLDQPLVETLEDRDWVAHALEGLGVVRAGSFVLYGRHDAENVSNDDGILLQIEANRAFGTGHHPTTAGCLEILSALQSTAPQEVLDIGTGSGVLALAARKLWPEADIVATDIDAPSIGIAKEHSEINGVTDINWGVAAGTDSPLIKNSAPYEMVFANILAGPLKELAPDINAVIKPHGHLILAGLLDEQEASVLETYEALGFKLTSRDGTERWPTLHLVQEASS